MDHGPHSAPQQDHHGDQAEHPATLTPKEAGRLLGVSDERVRQMLEAGELVGEKVNGRWRADANDVHRLVRERGEPRPKKPKDNPDRGELVEVLRQQLEDIRADRDAWREQARRNDHIIAALTQRVPEIQAPSQADEDAPGEPHSPGPTSTPTGTTQSPQTATSRPFWRRIFGNG